MLETFNLKFRTAFNLQDSAFRINYSDDICCMGSCFAEEIGQKLRTAQFKALINPLGIAYNPVSLAKHLGYILDASSLVPSDLRQRQDLFQHFDFHGKFGDTNRDLYISTLVNQCNNTKAYIQKAKYIFITLGTAIVYQLKTDQRIVNNCHKFPALNFDKKLLSTKQVIHSLEVIVERIKSLQENAKIIFTVSPIRHLKSGFRQNQLSKSTLHLAVQALEQTNTDVSYFPSYELIQDDLRDYRFFKEDSSKSFSNCIHMGKIL